MDAIKFNISETCCVYFVRMGDIDHNDGEGVKTPKRYILAQPWRLMTKNTSVHIIIILLFI
jgi:hypothetical protein